jgi:uncharacterized protein YcfL
MKQWVTVLIAVLLLAACKNKNAIPAGVLSPEKMQTLLWDMARADQYLTDFILNKDTTLKESKERIKLYQQVLAIHKTNEKQFKESFAFYQHHPDYLKQVLDSINIQANRAPTEIYHPQPLNDTILKKLDTVRNKLMKKPIAD